MNSVLQEMHRVLKPEGYVCLVIGNTTMLNVKIKSAEVLADYLESLNFSIVQTIKRKIPYKLIPTIRDKKTGKFSKLNNKNSKLVYPEEYIIIAKKWNMAIIEKNKQPFEPYARLMNILGDQLITDKKVAVIELVKNCYDADAKNVQVRFLNMNNYGKNYLSENEQPYIEIEDDGEGMTINTIRTVWLRPATPNKLKKKNIQDIRTKLGRKIQGEKGIGRFAIHKLGERIQLFTKAFSDNEIKVDIDFTEFNPEKYDLFNQTITDQKLLKDIDINWSIQNPAEEIIKPNGTLIRISHLRGEEWTKNDYDDIYKAIQRLVTPYDENAEYLGVEFKSDFSVELFVNNQIHTNEKTITFADVIDRAQYKMFGCVSTEGILTFNYKSIAPIRKIKNREINLFDDSSLSNKFNYSSVAINEWKKLQRKSPKCGSFCFSFYAFNLKNPDRNIYTKDLEEFTKDNFVFLYRDGIRVYPFGEKGYDWLDLDKLRSTKRAGNFISYNDLTGFVYISQEKNPLLKDASNRQDIMDIDGALQDFKSIVTAITEIFNVEIKIDKGVTELAKRKNISFKDSESLLSRSFDELRKILEKTQNKEILEKANKFLKSVHNHNITVKDRMATVEDLAGLGMAVEKSSHDALMILKKMRINVKDFKVKAKNQDYSSKDLIKLLSEIDENLEFVYEEMQIIQPLFKIQRKAISDVSVYENIEKVKKYFRREIENKIDIQIIKDKDIVVKTNTGLVLQVLINLLDNAIYWVNKGVKKKKEILFKINTKNNSILLADNGPGIREDVEPLIFQEFFSLKSDGRGLGLYIVKEILLRINAEISVIQDDTKKVLPGANFLIKFNNEEI